MNDMLSIMPYIWLGTAVFFGIAEALTDQLVAIWFAIGAIAAMLISYTRITVWVQFFVFIAVSSAVLYLLRPMATRAMRAKSVRTNVSSLIGMVGTVITDIDNARGIGRINLNNSDWAARSEDGQPILAGEQVVVRSITGVTASVERI